MPVLFNSNHGNCAGNQGWSNVVCWNWANNYFFSTPVPPDRVRDSKNDCVWLQEWLLVIARVIVNDCRSDWRVTVRVIDSDCESDWQWLWERLIVIVRVIEWLWDWLQGWQWEWLCEWLCGWKAYYCNAILKWLHVVLVNILF